MTLVTKVAQPKDGVASRVPSFGAVYDLKSVCIISRVEAQDVDRAPVSGSVGSTGLTGRGEVPVYTLLRSYFSSPH